jgi:hypothetical protein
MDESPRSGIHSVVLHFLQIGHIRWSSSIKPPDMVAITAKTRQNRLNM